MRSRRSLPSSKPIRSDGDSRPDLPLLVASLVLVGFGTVMVYSSSAIYAWANSEFGNEFFFLKRHLFRVGIGLCAMWVAQRIDYRFWSRAAKPLVVLCLLLLVAVLVIGSGTSHGATRWLRVSFLSVQPGELMKIALVIYLASFLVSKADLIKDFKRGLVPPLIVLGLATVLVVKQPNFGTAAALLLIGFLVLYMGGSRLHHMAAAGLAGLLAVGLLAYTMPYARQRVAGFLGASTGSAETNYQVRQSILGMGCGGIFGEGLGGSKFKLLSLPEPHTDFVFAVVAEELGFLGSIILMGCFLFIMIRGMKIALSCQDTFGMILAAGLSACIFTYVLLHIAVVLGAVPTTGLPLPFLSFGGTALFTNLVSIGIILSVSKHSQNPRQSFSARRYVK
jgi:cell division protein FtsW